MAIALCASVEERNGTYSKTIIKNKIIKSSVKQTWENVIDYVIGTTEMSEEVDIAIEKGHLTLKLHSNTGTETFEANPDDYEGTAYEFNKNFKYVKFIVDVTESSTSSSCVQESDRSSIAGPSVFDKLMNRSTKQPQKKIQSLRFPAYVNINSEIYDSTYNNLQFNCACLDNHQVNYALNCIRKFGHQLDVKNNKGYNQAVQYRFHIPIHVKLPMDKCTFCKAEFTAHCSLKRHQQTFDSVEQDEGYVYVVDTPDNIDSESDIVIRTDIDRNT
ncbi:unnamed protein product [Mytilus edulis]|uniref:Uncharacterized protein n=1 Tax=Mytilus edulis TaxID=6550 RepID=A0A8S3TGB7_MYTED|nr:unnamed protein product [Mytilus edulis]